MFSASIIWYLFFAGVGSGASFTIFLIDSFLRRFKPQLFESLKALIAPGHAISLALVVLSTIFLVFDLGRIDRLLDLFIAPNLTILTIGAWSLLVYMILTDLQLLLRLRLPATTHRYLHIIVRWMTMLSAVAVMVYAGLLLKSLSSVHFWNTPLLPVLFVLSSLSSGLALVMLIGLFRQSARVPLELFARFSRTHLPLLVCELLLLVVYLFWAMQRSTTAAAAAVSLISGDYLVHFWGGVVVCGILLPSLIEAFAHRMTISILIAFHAIAILVGAFALRYCFLMVGAPPQMLSPPLIM